eukprot:435960-Prorocentrum_minimum.AAC.1
MRLPGVHRGEGAGSVERPPSDGASGGLSCCSRGEVRSVGACMGAAEARRPAKRRATVSDDS